MASKKGNLDIKNPELENNEDVVQEEQNVPAEAPVTDIIDIQIKEVPKQKFRINGDDSRVLALNLSDLNVSIRLQKGYDELARLMKEISDTPTDTEDFRGLTKNLEKIDKEMRKQLDYIFDSNVSEVCAPSGNMYDPYNGTFRYESILDSLTKLYTDNLNEEYRKMRKRLSKHTDKYLK